MINGTLIKVCGMRQPENIRQVETINGVDILGFIFHPRSPRYVECLPDYLPTHARRAGVFVNEQREEVVRQTERFGLELVQLHGNESPDDCRYLRSTGVQVIKAFPVASLQDLEGVQNYESACDLLLFDTRCKGYGGSGKSFDWNILEAYEGDTPFLLSGGIGPESAEALCRFAHPRLAGYDLNSRFERSPGVKDARALRSFLEEIDSLSK